MYAIRKFYPWPFASAVSAGLQTHKDLTLQLDLLVDHVEGVPEFSGVMR